MTIYNQRDSRWADVKLGFGATTIGSHGCTITCIGMLADLPPDEVNDRLKKVNGFQKDLVIWSKIKEAIPWLEFEWRGYDYDNAKVLDAISKYKGCLVEVDFDGRISTPNDHHWVLYTGNGQLVDPWTGTQKSTGWYSNPTGYSVIKNLPKVDSDLKWLKQMYLEQGVDLNKSESEVRVRVQEIFDGYKKYGELEKRLQRAEKDLAGAKAEAADFEQRLITSEGTIKRLNKEIDDLRAYTASRDAEITSLKEKLESLSEKLDPDISVIVSKEEYLKLLEAKKKVLEAAKAFDLLKALFRKLWRR